MDAKPWLVEVGRRLRQVDLEMVLIGNAAAALQGAPVTTVDFDFLFRKTPRNLRKLKALARARRHDPATVTIPRRTSIASCASATACNSISW